MSTNPPEILWKYASAASTQLILSGPTIAFTSPAAFNDPFDSRWNPFWELSDPTGVAALEAMVRRWWGLAGPPQGATFSSLIRSNALAQSFGHSQLGSVVSAQTLRRVEAFGRRAEAAAHQGVVNASNTLQILCLSESTSSLLLWSHYADQHRGAALGFDSAVLRHCFPRSATPFRRVDYASTHPRLNQPLGQLWEHFLFDHGPAPDYDALAQAQIFVKSDDWRYEHEWRCAIYYKGGAPADRTFHQFPPRALREVVLGAHMEPADAAAVDALARGLNPGVRIRRATVSSKRFGIDLS